MVWRHSGKSGCGCSQHHRDYHVDTYPQPQLSIQRHDVGVSWDAKKSLNDNADSMCHANRVRTLSSGRERARDAEVPSAIKQSFSLSLDASSRLPLRTAGRARHWRGRRLELTTGPQHPQSAPLGAAAVVCSLPPGRWRYVVWWNEKGNSLCLLSSNTWARCACV